MRLPIVGLLAATALMSFASTPASSADAPPTIVGISLGMSADEVEAKLKELSPSTPLRTYRSAKSDGTGNFVRGLSIDVETGGQGSGFERARDRVAVVFAEFGGGAHTVMRMQKFPLASLPGIVPVREAVAKAYGATLQRQNDWGRPVFVGLSMRGRDGKPTQDAKCVYTTKGNSTGGMLMEGMNTWTDYYPQCGVLVRVEATPADDEAFVTAMEQRMADSQAILKEIAERDKVANSAAEEKAKAAVARANQVAPRL